jgi:hypothetical protein
MDNKHITIHKTRGKVFQKQSTIRMWIEDRSVTEHCWNVNLPKSWYDYWSTTHWVRKTTMTYFSLWEAKYSIISYIAYNVITAYKSHNTKCSQVYGYITYDSSSDSHEIYAQLKSLLHMRSNHSKRRKRFNATTRLHETPICCLESKNEHWTEEGTVGCLCKYYSRAPGLCAR